MKNIHTRFDLYEPTAGHRERFKKKLDSRLNLRGRIFKPVWKPEMVAAILLIMAGLFFMNDIWKPKWMASGIYPQVKEKQQEWTAYLKDTFLEWERFETPESQKLIQEAFQQLKRLEKDYRELKLKFEQTGNRFVLDAMIENARQRQELLEDLKQKLIQVEKMKRHENEKHTS